LWRFPTGEPIVEPPVVVNEHVYVAVQPGGMYCLELKTGAEAWFAPAIKQFLAASRRRVYASDTLGRIAVLDMKTGMQRDVMPVPRSPIRLRNADTDRIYLASSPGLIQCLHEVENPQPIEHRQARMEEPMTEKRPVATQKSQEKLQTNSKPIPSKKPAAKKDDWTDPFTSDDTSIGGDNPFGFPLQ